MSFPAWIAAIVLFLQLPIPLYWFVLHPFKGFWHDRGNSVYVVALFCSWLPATAVLVIYHRALLRTEWPPAWRFALGVVLIASEIWIFRRVRRDLGGARLVGATELSGGGEIEQTGIYGRIRHPRYTGSFLALIGACLLAATRITWIVAAVWTVLMGIAVTLEERELRTRFGDAYREYRRRVPGFVPRLNRPR